MMVLPSTKLLLTVLFLITVLGNAGSKSLPEGPDGAKGAISGEKSDKRDDKSTHKEEERGATVKVTGDSSKQETWSTGSTTSTAAVTQKITNPADVKEPLSEDENGKSKNAKEKDENDQNKNHKTEEGKLGGNIKEQATEKNTATSAAEKKPITDPTTSTVITSVVTEKSVENNPPEEVKKPEDDNAKDTGNIKEPVQQKQVDKPPSVEIENPESKELKSDQSKDNNESWQVKETKFVKNMNPGQEDQETQSSFVGYLIVLCFVTIIAFLVFHNKKKILGLIVEGRSGRQAGRRRSGGKEYRKLDSNVEDILDSGKETNMRQVIY